MLVLIALCAASTGCSMFQKKAAGPPGGTNELTQEQRDWWEANRNRARYVQGRGYYVDGVSGYFDENGRPMKTASAKDDDFDPDEVAFVSEKRLKRNIKQAFGRGPNEPVAKSAFEEAQAAFKAADYDTAAKKYFVAYDRWPDSPLEQDALFLAGEANFFADRYGKAEDAFALLLKKYPNTPQLDKVINRRFAIARYWELQNAAHPHWPVTPNFADKTRPWFDTAGHAIRVYERIRLDDPTGPLADDAIMATANYYFVNGRFDEADYNYGLIRTEYPKSEFQYPAHMLGLQAKVLKYPGPDYEGRALEEADTLAKQIVQQFPTELQQGDRDRVLDTQARIKKEQAYREYTIANYYHKGKHYGASKMLYDNVAKKYPETELAKESVAKIEEVKGQPDVPPDRFAWLTGLFPESQKLGPTIATAPSKTKVR